MTVTKPTVLDIRRSTFEDSIPDQVINGLNNQPKTLPALLFYSTEGLQHWNHHSHEPEFYPYYEEMQILRKRAAEMASTIVPNSVVVDLGSASLDKVILLLEALEAQQKNIEYYALDLSAIELATALQAIPAERFQHVRFAGLHGTFDDGLQWLQDAPGIRDRPHCMLLLGLTIGNFSRSNAAAFLEKIARHALSARPHQSSILVTLDSCKVPTKVLRAYTSEGVVPFALTSLTYANTLFGYPVFNPEDWYFLSEWNYVLGRHEASLIPQRKDIILRTPLAGLTVRKDQKVRFGCSYKYDVEERERLFSEAGLVNTAVWGDDGCDVTFYALQLDEVGDQC